AEDGIRDRNVTGVQTCALPILKEKKTNELPNVIGFFHWLKDIIRGKSSNDIIVYMDKRDIPWTLFARLLAEDDLEDYLEQDEIKIGRASCRERECNEVVIGGLK